MGQIPGGGVSICLTLTFVKTIPGFYLFPAYLVKKTAKIFRGDVEFK
jgi:hypothetical protein